MIEQEFTFNETLGFFTDADGKVHPDSVKELNRRWLNRVLKQYGKMTVQQQPKAETVIKKLLKEIE
jgi:hypothetical protein